VVVLKHMIRTDAPDFVAVNTLTGNRLIASEKSTCLYRTAIYPA
jgi:hypothetical protein